MQLYMMRHQDYMNFCFFPQTKLGKRLPTFQNWSEVQYQFSGDHQKQPWRFIYFHRHSRNSHHFPHAGRKKISRNSFIQSCHIILYVNQVSVQSHSKAKDSSASVATPQRRVTQHFSVRRDTFHLP